MAKYTKMTVYIRQDPLPGWGHQQEDHIHLIENALNHSVPHYDPSVVDVETVDR
jgi:hypothetical protein